MVERFHRQLKASLRAHGSTRWTDSLPIVLLGVRSALRSDLQCSSAELVYGSTLRLPGEFFRTSPSSVTTSVPDLQQFAQTLRDTMCKLRPVPPRTPPGSHVFISQDLSSSSHVLVRRDAVRKPLDPRYDGPFKVVQRSQKTFVVDIKGRHEVIAVDRLKPAYLTVASVSAVTFPAPPPPPDPQALPSMNCKPSCVRWSPNLVAFWHIPAPTGLRGGGAMW
ncbi:uncharacterized protein LOC135400391 [Ornithodoros turicata]|uniref:uncharacterized protein LOC135400391 n=1 Tax=Ornithodoros turicata TaxID=34597 RepID=UPI0031398398